MSLGDRCTCEIKVIGVLKIKILDWMVRFLTGAIYAP